MTVQFFCQHGHELDITDELTDEELVCDRCGSVTRIRSSGDTRKSRPSDIAYDLEDPRQQGSSSEAHSRGKPGGQEEGISVDDADASMFQVTSPTRGCP